MARFTKARKFGRDEEDGHEALQEVIDDPDSDFGDILACAIECAPESEQSEVIEALRSMGEDRRGHRSWARDRLEMRRHARDERKRAKDQEERDSAMPVSGKPREMAGDSALRRRDTARQQFAEWFPEAAKIERG